MNTATLTSVPSIPDSTCPGEKGQGCCHARRRPRRRDRVCYGTNTTTTCITQGGSGCKSRTGNGALEWVLGKHMAANGIQAGSAVCRRAVKLQEYTSESGANALYHYAGSCVHTAVRSGGQLGSRCVHACQERRRVCMRAQACCVVRICLYV